MCNLPAAFLLALLPSLYAVLHSGVGIGFSRVAILKEFHKAFKDVLATFKHSEYYDVSRTIGLEVMDGVLTLSNIRRGTVIAEKQFPCGQFTVNVSDGKRFRIEQATSPVVFRTEVAAKWTFTLDGKETYSGEVSAILRTHNSVIILDFMLGSANYTGAISGDWECTSPKVKGHYPFVLLCNAMQDMLSTSVAQYINEDMSQYLDMVVMAIVYDKYLWRMSFTKPANLTTVNLRNEISRFERDDDSLIVVFNSFIYDNQSHVKTKLPDCYIDVKNNKSHEIAITFLKEQMESVFELIHNLYVNSTFNFNVPYDPFGFRVNTLVPFYPRLAEMYPTNKLLDLICRKLDVDAVTNSMTFECNYTLREDNSVVLIEISKLRIQGEFTIKPLSQSVQYTLLEIGLSKISLKDIEVKTKGIYLHNAKQMLVYMDILSLYISEQVSIHLKINRNLSHWVYKRTFSERNDATDVYFVDYIQDHL